MNEKRNTGGGIGAALQMLDIFGSVGVAFVGITHTNIDQEKRGFRPKESLQEAKRSMPFLLPKSAERRNNIIIRPHRPPAVLLVQLDDLAAEEIARVRPFAFVILQTSPGNHQAWLAVENLSNTTDADFTRRVRKGAGADPTASGATRIAGTSNYKRKYEPDFPVVEIAAAQPGLIVTRAALEAAGLVALPEPVKEYKTPSSRRARGVWPSYQHALAHAPIAHGEERADVSRADFTWCMTAIDWGWSVENVADRLIIESGKAQENGPAYALLTATNAAAAVARRQRELAP